MTDATTTLLLVRHGHVDGIDPPRFRGRTELALTPLGCRQAEALRDRIAMEWQPTAIYSSPMERCRETGATIAGPFGVAVEPVADLNDRDYGAWQGLSHAEVHHRWPEQYGIWRNAPHAAVIPRGETLDAVAERTLRALHAILHHHRGQTTVVVAHDSVNRVLLLRTLDLPLDRYWDITQAPCALNVLHFDGGRVKVATLNETGHLVRIAASEVRPAGAA